MTTNTSSLIQECALNRMVQLALTGQNQDPVLLDSALGVLNQCGFNEEQTAVIAAILRNVPSNNAIEATTAMKERILVVLSGEDIEINEVLEVVPNGPQIVPMDQICFSEHPIEIIDISEKIFKQCFARGDIVDLQALACVSVKLHQNLTWLVDYLNHFTGLTILDAKAQGITVDDEPCITKLQILKCFKDLAPHVENNEGLTLLTMAKGLTLNQLIAITAEQGRKVDFSWHQILRELGDVPVEQTYVILITNNIFLKSRDKFFVPQNNLVVGHGCEMPTVQEYVALCVFTYKCFQKCLYERNPPTLGRSSTHVGSNPLAVGNSFPDYLFVRLACSDSVNVGAGGRRKFSALGT